MTSTFTDSASNGFRTCAIWSKLRRPRYLLNIPVAEYVAHLSERLALPSFGLAFDRLQASQVERQVPAERFPPTFHVMRGQRYPKPAFVYHIPLEGNGEALRWIPRRRVRRTESVYVEGSDLCFEVIGFYDDPQVVKRQAEEVIGFLQQQSQNVLNDISGFNSELPKHIEQAVEARREVLSKHANMLSELGVPIRPAANVPDTFNIPTVRTKAVDVPRPTAARPVPEPVLAQAVYEQILEAIHDTGRAFERHPSTYRGKDEATLRDHLILVLEPRFEGM